MQAFPIHMAPLAAFDSLAPRRKVFLLGDGASGVASLITARLACEQRFVRLVCGDNRFDPYAITRVAKSRGIRPVEALSRIRIARAFTAYQLVELVERLEAYSMASEFVVVTGVCSAFFDEDLSHNDAARLFYQSYWKLVALAKSHMTLLLVESRALPIARRLYFLKELCQTSEVVLSLTGRATFTLEEKFKSTQKRLQSPDRLPGD
jgi:hypothetical protein